MRAATPVHDARARALRLLLGVTTVLLVAAACGALVGRAVWESRPPDDTDQWSDLGYGFVGLLLGLVVAGLVHLVGLVLAVRWAVPRGQRLAMMFAVLAAQAVLAAALSSLAGAADSGGMQTLGTVVAVALVVAAAAGLGLLMDAVRPRTAGWLGGLAGGGFVLVLLVGGLRADSVAAGQRVDRYEATGAPLALVERRDLAAPVGGWELDHVDQGWGYDSVSVYYDLTAPGPEVREQVRLALEGDPDPRACEGAPDHSEGACDILAPAVWTDDGGAGARRGAILGERITGGDGVTTTVAVWVDVPGGRWTILGSDVDEADAVAVLRSLVPVDADTFTAAT